MSKKREALTQVIEDVFRLYDHNQLNESKDDKVARSLRARIKENISAVVVQEARDILHESGMDDEDLASLSDDPSAEEELLLGGDHADAGDEISQEELLVDGESEEEGEFEEPSDDEEGDDFDLGGEDEPSFDDFGSDEDEDDLDGEASLGGDDEEGDLEEADTFLTQEDIDAIERELDGYSSDEDAPSGDDFDDLDLGDDSSDEDEASLGDEEGDEDELSLGDEEGEPSLDDEDEWK